MIAGALAGPLLETKLYAPVSRRAVVARPRLLDRLHSGANARLTLVSAPAGFGKTTLLAEWLAACRQSGRATAWLSLDRSDNHATSFWTYLITALQRAAPGVGADASSMLQASSWPIEQVVSSLLNDLSIVSNEIVLVLDDYHVIDSREIQDAMGFLLDHLPPQLHLVIASRADPALPLARMRARGELVEIRSADLRFTPNEATAYLAEVMGLKLEARHVEVLEQRTEGWIAALQLAALSMQGRDDVTDFIAEFAGDSRYIVDYLLEEVLQRQPDEVRRFLLRTSVLDRLNASLCDAVTQQHDGKDMLETLERGNLFVVALDDRRRWFRYHHLFADVLRAHLADEPPEDVAALHRRASEWCERNAEPGEAIRHAFAAEDFGRAADLIELAWPAVRQTRQEHALREWLAALPADLLRCRPVLSNAYAGMLLVNGVLEGVDDRLRDAEHWVNQRERQAAMVVVDEEEFRRLPGLIALHRVGLAMALGNVEEATAHARRVLEVAQEDDHLARGGAVAFLGLAAWRAGDLETAYQTYAAGMADVRRAGHVSGSTDSALFLAEIRAAQGRLTEAMRAYKQALELATEHSPNAPRGTADLYIGMSHIELERGDAAAATLSLQRAEELGEHNGMQQHRYRRPIAMARIREAQGDLEGALILLDEAERLYANDYSPNMRPVPALKARIQTRLGRVGEALAWAREQGLTADDALSYVREFEHITLARVLLASGSVREAIALLDRLLRAADEGGRTASVIEILLLQALAFQQHGGTRGALAPLERALALAEPECYVRIFLDEGTPMVGLLRSTSHNYARRLLESVGRADVGMPARQQLVEPLSDRELDVLRLLGTDLDGPDIASELMVSLNTMRTHTKSIYTKLGVNSRRAAVRRAEELDLLAPRAR